MSFTEMSPDTLKDLTANPATFQEIPLNKVKDRAAADICPQPTEDGTDPVEDLEDAYVSKEKREKLSEKLYLFLFTLELFKIVILIMSVMIFSITRCHFYRTT